MTSLRVITVCLLLSFACAHSKILLSDVKELTFHALEVAKSKKAYNKFPQLVHVGETSGSVPVLDLVTCTRHSDGPGDPTWRCSAKTPEGMAFGKTDVICEGFSYPDDPYILEGSCSLEYELNPITHVVEPTPQPQPQATLEQALEANKKLQDEMRMLQLRYEDSMRWNSFLGVIIILIMVNNFFNWLNPKPLSDTVCRSVPMTGGSTLHTTYTTSTPTTTGISSTHTTYNNTTNNYQAEQPRRNNVTSGRKRKARSPSTSSNDSSSSSDTTLPTLSSKTTDYSPSSSTSFNISTSIATTKRRREESSPAIGFGSSKRQEESSTSTGFATTKRR